MRLIDVDKINFEEVFGGQSDFAKDIRESAQNLIDRQPTAFNKEKVIEELDKLTGEECTLHECGIRSERCRPCIAKKAIEIVEKGGIECV